MIDSPFFTIAQKVTDLLEPKEDLLISVYARHSLIPQPVENIQIFQDQNRIYCREPHWDWEKDRKMLSNLSHLEPTIYKRKRPIDQKIFEQLLEKIYLLPDVNFPELPMILDSGFCRLTINLPNFKSKYIWADTYYDYLPKDCMFIYNIRQEIYKTIYPDYVYVPFPKKVCVTNWEYIKYHIFNFFYINKTINYLKRPENQ